MRDDHEYDEIEYMPVQDVPVRMMFWQVIAGTLGAGILTGLLTYLWLVFLGVDPSCGGGARVDADGGILSGLGGLVDCLEVIGGWPEIFIGNLGMLAGSTLAVFAIGHFGGASRSLIKVWLIPAAVLILLQFIFPKDLILLRGLMVDLVQFDFDWELIRAMGIMGIAATASYFFMRK